MPTFIMLSVVMLNVVAPCKTFLVRLILVGKVKAYLGGAPPYGSQYHNVCLGSYVLGLEDHINLIGPSRHSTLCLILKY